MIGKTPPTQSASAISTTIATEQKSKVSTKSIFKGKKTQTLPRENLKTFMQMSQSSLKKIKQFLLKNRRTSIATIKQDQIKPQKQAKRLIAPNYNALKKSLQNVSNYPELRSINVKISQSASKGLISPHQKNELLSIVKLRQSDIQFADTHHTQKPSLASNLETQAKFLETVHDAINFKRTVISLQIHQDIDSGDKMRLQGKLTKQLNVIAEDKEQAKNMTLKVLIHLTGDAQVAKTIAKKVTNTLGYMPHYDTRGLDERAHNLKSK